ncbi:hypothetical protein BHE74_00022327 [Ensete ventricosum]|nr:hypothetical protein BHE74_00022327 [Ensete ventricosum]
MGCHHHFLPDISKSNQRLPRTIKKRKRRREPAIPRHMISRKPNPKTGTHRRHKVEKLRKRHRSTDRVGALSVSVRPSPTPPAASSTDEKDDTPPRGGRQEH